MYLQHPVQVTTKTSNMESQIVTAKPIILDLTSETINRTFQITTVTKAIQTLATYQFDQTLYSTAPRSHLKNNNKLAKIKTTWKCIFFHRLPNTSRERTDTPSSEG